MPIKQGRPERNGLCATGVAGLDDVLAGGLPRTRIYLLQGDPGVGKTTNCPPKFLLLEGARLGENGLYITLSETKEELEEVGKSHGWDLNSVSMFELSALADQLKEETDSISFFHPSEIELNRTTKALLGEVERVKASRVVFDSLSEMRISWRDTPLRYRKQILPAQAVLLQREEMHGAPSGRQPLGLPRPSDRERCARGNRPREVLPGIRDQPQAAQRAQDPRGEVPGGPP